MVFDATEILLGVLAVLSALVTGVLVPWIRTKTTAAQQTELKAWVRIAVAAAEQLYSGGGRGEEKKQYVVSWLKQRGVVFDLPTIDAAIEAAVYELTK